MFFTTENAVHVYLSWPVVTLVAVQVIVPTFR
jgi:hypothetical protein